MVKKIGVLICALMIVAFFAGCAKVPQVEMDAAKAALENAKNLEADRYLPAEYKALTDKFNAASAELEKQKGKFFISRNYDQAKQMFLDVAKSAEGLKDAVAGAKEKTKLEAEQMIAQYQPLLNDTKALFKKAPRGKEGRAALDAIQGDIKSVEASFAQIAPVMEKGDFVTAKDRIQSVLQKLQGINNELKQAVAKKTSRK